MSHPPLGRAAPAPAGGRFLAAPANRAALGTPRLWVLLASLAMLLVLLPAQAQNQP